MKNTCSECKHWDRNDIRAPDGFCRAKPPQCVLIQTTDAQGRTGGQFITYWPRVQASDFCGEYAARLAIVNMIPEGRG